MSGNPRHWDRWQLQPSEPDRVVLGPALDPSLKSVARLEGQSRGKKGSSLTRFRRHVIIHVSTQLVHHKVPVLPSFYDVRVFGQRSSEHRSLAQDFGQILLSAHFPKTAHEILKERKAHTFVLVAHAHTLERLSVQQQNTRSGKAKVLHVNVPAQNKKQVIAEEIIFLRGRTSAHSIAKPPCPPQTTKWTRWCDIFHQSAPRRFPCSRPCS